MRAVPECLSCIIDDLWGALCAECPDKAIQFEVLRRAAQYLASNSFESVPPSYHITKVHRILKEVSGIQMPFRARREAANLAGIELAKRVRQRASSLEEQDRFLYLVNWAIAANGLDFRTVGTGYEFDATKIEEMLQSYTSDLAVDQVSDIYDTLKRSKCVFFVHDNVGEIALDKLLVEEMRAMGLHVVSGLRGGPITSDATMEDGHVVSLDRAANEVVCVGPDTLGLSFDEMSEKCREQLDAADIVIAKGQANFYVLSEFRREIRGIVACLFRTKCDVAAGRFGLKGEVNIAALI